MPTSTDTEYVFLLEFAGLAGEFSFEAAFPREKDSSIVRIDPLAGVKGDAPVDLAQQAAALADGLLGLKRCRAVAANCNGAPLAVHLASALAARGAAPLSVVLVNAVATTADDLRAVVAELLAGLGATGEVLADLPWSAEPALLHAAIMRCLREATIEHLRSVLEEDEDLDMVAESLVGRYAAWIGLLTGNLAARRPELRVPVQCLRTVDHGRDDVERLLDARADVTVTSVPDAEEAADTPLANPWVIARLRELVGHGDVADRMP